ncbi:NAD(P)/FAD-dependent oxidoreductase [Thaumasiovibrio sp. DFM-14]|uniref:NAD(P)/FAD-dependent oxidoreductase n=1 Tax=Thaumasiovibrio sp. DFM-14 TaxID=3384792 RepID=UPI0039A093BC
MKIAIIGSGISGLTAAWYLQQQHEVTLFESAERLGGHTATVDVTVPSGQYAVDTGFIVFNDRTYPNFERLLGELGIERQPTEMSFSVKNEATGLEYNGHTLSTMFAQRKNLLRPSFYYLLFEIVRFNRLAKRALQDDEALDGTLGDFLQHHQFSAPFVTNYILPMGAAIWSSTLCDMRAFPLRFFMRFFINHGLLDVTNRPQWYVIPGGSREYIRRMEQQWSVDVKLNASITAVSRSPQRVDIDYQQESQVVRSSFDQVIFACHSDQALRLLSDASAAEQQVLGAIPYQENEVVLHTDSRLLPNTKAAWASWNYLLRAGSNQDTAPTALTYNMSKLQGLSADETFCVTLNQTEMISEEKILASFNYSHPVFNLESVEAQQQRGRINGQDGTWFCGAYWYNGFHEDGVRSALDVVHGIRQQPMLVDVDSQHEMTA